MKKSFFIFLTMLSSFSCKEDPVSVSYTPVFSNESLTIDTLQVSVGIDTGSGFQYPQNYIDIFVSLQWSNSVLFCDIELCINDTLFRRFSGYSNPLRVKRRYWFDYLRQAGTNFDYTLKFIMTMQDHQRDTIVLQGSTVVTSNQAYNIGEKGSTQLTKGLHPYSPVFSKDGKWIYFADVDIIASKKFVKRLSVNNPNIIEVLHQGTDEQLNYTLMNSDSILLIVQSSLFSNSLMIKKNLFTQRIDTVALAANIPYGRIAEVPGSGNILAFMDTAGIENMSPFLALINATNGSIQIVTGLQSSIGYIDDFVVRPSSNEITYCIRSGYSHFSVYLYNLETKSMTMFIEKTEGQKFLWAPDGISYAIINWNTFFYSRGNMQQLTYYPSADHDISFSPTDKLMAFTSERRGRRELWKIIY